MKRVFGRIIAAIVCGSMGFGCAPSDDEAGTAGGIRVLAPMFDQSGSYGLQTPLLEGVTDTKAFEGKYAKFYLSPRIVNNKLEGVQPKSRFIENRQGEFIPGNEMTQQMVTIYAHMQRLAHLDKEFGLEGVNQWPRAVGVAVNIRGGSHNNAFYDGVTDSMLFVPYNQKNLPIAVNGGILAHEHFHSLFYKLVMKDSPYKGNVHSVELEKILKPETKTRERQALQIQSKRQTYQLEEINYYYYYTLSRAMNEGLADFWGWMYTGDPDFIAQSLPKEKGNRSLKSGFASHYLTVPTSEEIKNSLLGFFVTGDNKVFKDYAVGYAYQLATRFSRVLKTFTDIYAESRNLENQKARQEVAQAIIDIFPSLRKAFELDVSTELYSPLDALVALSEKIVDLQSEECSYLVKVLNNSLERSDESEYRCEGETSLKIQKVAKTLAESLSKTHSEAEAQ